MSNVEAINRAAWSLATYQFDSSNALAPANRNARAKPDSPRPTGPAVLQAESTTQSALSRNVPISSAVSNPSSSAVAVSGGVRNNGWLPKAVFLGEQRMGCEVNDLKILQYRRFDHAFCGALGEEKIA
jgi:hypothetical protein